MVDQLYSKMYKIFKYDRIRIKVYKKKVKLYDLNLCFKYINITIWNGNYSHLKKKMSSCLGIYLA